MKRVLALLLTVAMLVTLCACGSGGDDGKGKQEVTEKLAESGEKVPSEEMIMEDARDALTAKNQYATLIGMETVKSLTNEGSYELTVSVIAETKYADWTYEADLSYTKYDQGWMLDDVNWTHADYKQTRIPDTDTMVNHATQYLSEHEVLSDSLYSEYIVPINAPSMSSSGTEETILFLEWYAHQKLKHGYRFYRFESLWQYDSEIDNWVLVEDDSSGSYGYRLHQYYRGKAINTNLDFSGYWREERWINGEGEITETFDISNFTWEGFDVCIPELSDEIQHFVKAEDAPDEISYGQDWIFTNGQEAYITFEMIDEGTFITYTGRSDAGFMVSLQVFVTASLPMLG